jgi:hypothetical protein
MEKISDQGRNTHRQCWRPSLASSQRKNPETENLGIIGGVVRQRVVARLSSAQAHNSGRSFVRTLARNRRQQIFRPLL